MQTRVSSCRNACSLRLRPVRGGGRYPQAGAIAARLAADPDQAAPHVIDVEVLGVIRAQHLRGRLDGTAAGQAVADLRDWPGERFGHQFLLERARSLRDSVRGWDAVYVALAEILDATLLTMDERLALAPGPTCRIEVPCGGTLLRHQRHRLSSRGPTWGKLQRNHILSQ
jgi:predicted nucleic acid-binding protein